MCCMKWRRHASPARLLKEISDLRNCYQKIQAQITNNDPSMFVPALLAHPEKSAKKYHVRLMYMCVHACVPTCLSSYVCIGNRVTVYVFWERTCKIYLYTKKTKLNNFHYHKINMVAEISLAKANMMPMQVTLPSPPPTLPPSSTGINSTEFIMCTDGQQHGRHKRPQLKVVIRACAASTTPFCSTCFMLWS